MPQHMWRHLLLRKRGAGTLSSQDMVSKGVLDGVCAEPSSSAARKKKGRFVVPLFVEPRVQYRRRWFAQPRAPFFSSLPRTADMRSRLEHRVALSQPRELRKP